MIGVALLKFPTKFADAFTRFGQKLDLGDLSEFGLPIPEEGVFTRLARAGGEPTIVDKEVIEAIKARRFEVVVAVNSLDGSAVHLEGGASVQPDAVICATDTAGSWGRSWVTWLSPRSFPVAFAMTGVSLETRRRKGCAHEGNWAGTRQGRKRPT